MTTPLNRRGFGRRITTTALAAATAGAGALGLSFPLPAAAQAARALNGAGATFPGVLYSKWADEYVRRAGVQINYQAIGSGGGIKAHQDLTADFGATDAPMTDTQMADAKGGATLHVPMTMGATVPTYNIAGVTTPIKFTGPVLADIFLGKIKKWNDPALAAENAGVSLPNADIITVHRSDGSGTTFNWVDYLSKVSAEWKEKVGASTTVNWPGGIGGQGNAGVAGEIKQTPNSIGYVELAYAVQNKLGVGLVKNKAGAYPQPSFDSVTAAASGALDTMADDLRVSITNPDGEASWPVSTFTWLLVYRQQRDMAKGQALADYMFWCITEGQKFCQDLYYAPLPQQMLPLVYSKIESMNVRGEPLLNPANKLPQPVRPREVVNTVDNGNGTATTYYSDGTSETYSIGG